MTDEDWDPSVCSCGRPAHDVVGVKAATEREAALEDALRGMLSMWDLSTPHDVVIDTPATKAARAVLGTGSAVTR